MLLPLGWFQKYFGCNFETNWIWFIPSKIPFTTVFINFSTEFNGKKSQGKWLFSNYSLTPKHISCFVVIFAELLFFGHPVSFYIHKIPVRSSKLHYFIHHIRNWRIKTITVLRMPHVRPSPISSIFWNHTREWFRCCCCSLCSAIQSTWSSLKSFRTASTAIHRQIFHAAGFSFNLCRHRC